MQSTPLTAIDLFCGCGGISTGLRLAGVQVLAGADSDAKYLASFTHNFPSSQSLLMDLSKIPPQEFLELAGVKAGSVDLLAGGPPCQGFSKNVPRRNRTLADPKNRLLQTFLDYTELIRPRFVLLENVAEMRNGFEKVYTDEICARLASAGYSVSHAVVNAADHGVPQRRRRAFFLARAGSDTPLFPAATHAPPDTPQALFARPTHVTVWEAIGDLPSLSHGEGRPSADYSVPPMSSFQANVRRGSSKVTNHVARALRPNQFARLAALAPGQAHKDLPEHLRPQSGYSGAYGRLTKEMVAPTITRWVFHPGSGRWGHPVDTRTLTIREAARIQGFPDDFEFVGSYNDQAGQVGNAVPPMLIAQLVASLIGRPLRAPGFTSTRSASGTPRLKADRQDQEAQT